MVGNTVRVTSPSRSSPRKVSVSMRWEIPPMARRNSLKRNGPSPSRVTTSTDHLSPTRESTSPTARQSAGKCVWPGFIDVPSCAALPVTYLASVISFNQGSMVNQGVHAMAKPRIAVIVGSNRRDSINRKLAHALARLGADKVDANFVRIDDLPMFNQDLEGNLPAEVVRFKNEIGGADGVLMVKIG